MRHFQIAAIGGDGVGPEVIAAGVEVLQALAARDGQLAFAVETLPWGSAHYLEHGHYIPAGGLERLGRVDALFFGAGGAPPGPRPPSFWGGRRGLVPPLRP